MLRVLPGWGVKGGGVACGEEQQEGRAPWGGALRDLGGGPTLQDGW